MPKEGAYRARLSRVEKNKDKDKEGSSKSANVVAVDADSDVDFCFVSSNVPICVLFHQM